ncbi:hypothetical protein B0J12DRAFT_737974 [Macrophomina phaseolina]|uniref:Uncharacterized protein n=1 Tax=Macrophomina phaseolina TaxID=35725 RepID=A0ABQ8GIW0_9PEZI|nr:hypothetical protein B0J12DRAFT_737974 [Macrophomina phaseolina]
MKDSYKLRPMLWLSGVQFILSSLVLAMNSPARVFVRKHPGPDVLLHGSKTQHRKLMNSTFILHLWSIELACGFGLCGIFLFAILLGFICRYGWEPLTRKVRNPSGVTGTSRRDDPMSNPNHLVHSSRKMIFFHPRVIISTCLLTNLFFGAAAAIAVFISYGTSDHFDLQELYGGQHLGSFNLETYICEILLWAVEDKMVDPANGPLYNERCVLARGARWMTLLSALFTVFQFFFCVWMLDNVTRPKPLYAVSHEHRKTPDLSTRSQSSTSPGQKFPEVARVAERF